MDKLCKHCSTTKPQKEFVPSKVTKSGFRGICKECHNAYYRQRRVNKHDLVRTYEKKFHTKRRLKSEYNITEEYYAQMQTQQNKCCAICTRETKLVIDHCHTTLQVRGLLCRQCNLGLGHFKDNPTLLIKAKEYLEKKYVE